MATDDSDRLRSEAEVAEQLGISPESLRYYRAQGRGPTYVRVGRHVRYRQQDIDAWVESQTVGSRPA